ncbi:MAG: hypothetical protein IKP76_00065 [Bacilli bacterium]|nr:hypothetical protein [Bacilli bacterium]
MSVIKKFLPYLIVSVICLIASLIYEHFSHGVVSIYMLHAWAVPCVAGFIRVIFDKYLNNTIYRSGWITLLCYSYMRGVIEIYGTTNKLLPYFLYAGIIILLLSVTIVEKKKKKTSK